jgi:hypothetical protein
VDIYHLPSLTRLHAAFTKIPPTSTSDQKINANTTAGDGLGMEGENRSALIMGIHLSFVPMVGDELPPTKLEQVEPKEKPNANPDIEDDQREPANPDYRSIITPQTLKLRAILAFEDGRVEAWECRDWAVVSDARLGQAKQAERGGWECRWREKGHNEASKLTVFERGDGGMRGTDGKG